MNPETSQPQRIQVDIAIIGGGVAGLWLLNRARNAGYHAVLFEQHALGGGQSVASQGMIHGGVKYTLSGALSGASEAIADMPEHWRRCMAGEGDVDLRGTRLLSDHFYMWSSQTALSKVTTFLASKALRGRVDTVKKPDYPDVFRHPEFSGTLYKLVDRVIDTPTLLETLRAAQADHVLAIDWQHARLQRNGNGADIALSDGTVITSQLCVFSAGRGNARLMQQIGEQQPAMQLRPLQQVMVRHASLLPLYAHCVGTDSKPRLTISTHSVDGEHVWYLGGQLAEDGATMSENVLLQRAQQEMQALMPWINWQQAQWAVYRVDRAEPQQPGLLRPDNAWLSPCAGAPDCLVAWPTKLTLTPNLGNLLMDTLRERQITPQYRDVVPASVPRMQTIAAAPWQEANWQEANWPRV